MAASQTEGLDGILRLPLRLRRLRSPSLNSRRRCRNFLLVPTQAMLLGALGEALVMGWLSRGKKHRKMQRKRRSDQGLWITFEQEGFANNPIVQCAKPLVKRGIYKRYTEFSFHHTDKLPTDARPTRYPTLSLCSA